MGPVLALGVASGWVQRVGAAHDQHLRAVNDIAAEHVMGVLCGVAAGRRVHLEPGERGQGQDVDVVKPGRIVGLEAKTAVEVATYVKSSSLAT